MGQASTPSNILWRLENHVSIALAIEPSCVVGGRPFRVKALTMGAHTTVRAIAKHPEVKYPHFQCTHRGEQRKRAAERTRSKLKGVQSLHRIHHASAWVAKTGTPRRSAQYRNGENLLKDGNVHFSHPGRLVFFGNCLSLGVLWSAKL